MTSAVPPSNAIELRQRRMVTASGAICATLVCTLLIWAKLRLVTDIPRTAYAAPEAAAKSQSSPTGEASAASELGSARAPISE